MITHSFHVVCILAGLSRWYLPRGMPRGKRAHTSVRLEGPMKNQEPSARVQTREHSRTPGHSSALTVLRISVSSTTSSIGQSSGEPQAPRRQPLGPWLRIPLSSYSRLPSTLVEILSITPLPFERLFPFTKNEKPSSHYISWVDCKPNHISLISVIWVSERLDPTNKKDPSSHQTSFNF
jgi:hypothetical protein